MSSEELVVEVQGMECEGCTQAVQNAVSQLPGITSVDVSLDDGTATVLIDSTRVKREQISEAIEDAGFDVP